MNKNKFYVYALLDPRKQVKMSYETISFLSEKDFNTKAGNVDMLK